MALNIYRSTDPSAPVLSGTLGALIGVLDACLVTGYGAKTAAGWSKDFIGTNLAAFRPPTGSRYYYRFDDTTTTTFRVRGYESMTDIDTGVNPFPSVVQSATGIQASKSNVAASTSRPWVIFADDRCFYLFIDPSIGNYYPDQLFIGDFVSYKPNDTYGAAILSGMLLAYSPQPNIGNTNHYIARGVDGINISRPVSKCPMNGLIPYWTANGSMGDSGVAYPDVISNNLIISGVYLVENGGMKSVLRGRMPGLWFPCHASPLRLGDTFAGAGGTDLSGRTFESFMGSNTTGVFAG